MRPNNFVKISWNIRRIIISCSAKKNKKDFHRYKICMLNLIQLNMNKNENIMVNDVLVGPQENCCNMLQRRALSFDPMRPAVRWGINCFLLENWFSYSIFKWYITEINDRIFNLLERVKTFNEISVFWHRIVFKLLLT